MEPPEVSPCRPARWKLALAFATIYVTWGTTYLAIKEGVKVYPPALFGGVRILLAGLLLLGGLALSGERLRLPLRELAWAALIGACLFIGGNGLITVGEITVPSGAASVMVATTPLWLALLETMWPWGERLRLAGWVGLVLGLAGVGILLAPKLSDPASLVRDVGPLLVLGSSVCWAVGSFVMRHYRRTGSMMTTAAYQMILGGAAMTLIGLALGEAERLHTGMIWTRGSVAFLYLLFVGSLCGFVAFAWLLGHVSAVLVGTYAYINPVVAILVGWWLDGEPVTAGILGGMVVILTGVALVRTAGTGRKPSESPVPQEPLRFPTMRGLVVTNLRAKHGKGTVQ